MLELHFLGEITIGLSDSWILDYRQNKDKPSVKHR